MGGTGKRLEGKKNAKARIFVSPLSLPWVASLAAAAFPSWLQLLPDRPAVVPWGLGCPLPFVFTD